MIRPNFIIDVGMHRGEDTEFYLAKGFDVLAIEANPKLAAAARTRFAREVETGRLRILNVAISSTTGTERLAVSDDMTIWSSLSPEFIRRNEQVGTRYHYIDVPAVKFEDVLRDFGVPYYLKVDIEGLDMLCVHALHSVNDRPVFVSIESNVSAGARGERVFDELANLWVLGYRGFKYINQRDISRLRCPNPPREGSFVDTVFGPESSGPFGEETPGSWKSVDACLRHASRIRLHYDLAGFGGRWGGRLPAKLYRGVRSRVLKQPIGWYDLHAKLGN